MITYVREKVFLVVTLSLMSFIISSCGISATKDISNKVVNEKTSILTTYRERQSLVRWQSIAIEGVDYESYYYKSKFFKVNNNCEISPGLRHIDVKASYNDASLNGPYFRRFALDFNFKEGEQYYLKGSFQGNIITIWMEDYSGRRVSSKLKGVSSPVPIHQSFLYPRKVSW